MNGVFDANTNYADSEKGSCCSSRGGELSLQDFEKRTIDEQ